MKPDCMAPPPTTGLVLTMEVHKLKEIFENRPEEELMAILCRHNNSVEAAVEAICDGEAISFETHENTQPKVLQPTSQQTMSHFTLRNKKFVNVIPPSKPALISSFCPKLTPMPSVPPAGLKRESSADQRRQNLADAQRMAWEKEKSDLQQVLKASSPQQDFGSDYVTEARLSELLGDPDFLASLDNDLYATTKVKKTKIYNSENASEACEHRGTPGSKLHRPLFQNAFKKMLKSIDEARSTKRRVSRKKEDELVKYETMQRESKEACRRAIEDHLKSFLEENPDGSFENWIEELHPENFGNKFSREENSKTVDHRFYLERSDHRNIWNSFFATKSNDNSRENSQHFVPARCCKTNNDMK